MTAQSYINIETPAFADVRVGQADIREWTPDEIEAHFERVFKARWFGFVHRLNYKDMRVGEWIAQRYGIPKTEPSDRNTALTEVSFYGSGRPTTGIHIGGRS
jgi:hypothetical protein